MDQANNSFEADKRRFRLGAAIVLIGLLLLAGSGLLGRSAYRHFKEKRSATQAREFLARADFRNAALCARQALQLNPTNVAACRVMAALADRSHSPAVLDWQLRIVQVDPGLENKLLLASASLRYQSPPFPLATQILEELATNRLATNLAGYHIVTASLALARQQLAEAETQFELATQLEPTNQLYVLNLAILRLGSTNLTKLAPARVVLEQMRADTNLALPALRALVVDRLANREPAAANEYSTQLLACPQATLTDQLQHLGILQQLQSTALPAQLQAVQHHAETNAAAVADVSTWMQANGLLAENLHWLTNLPAAMQAQPPVRLVLGDGYLQSADWQSLRDFTTRGNWEETDFLRLALLSQAWSKLGIAQVAASNWGSAVNATGNRYNALITLLGLAERWQLKSEREDLLERIVQKFPQQRWAQTALEQTYLATGQTAGLYRLYATLTGPYTNSAGYKNNLAALSLLLHTNLPRANQWAAENYAANTNDLIMAATYAYALHLQGRTQAGLAVMRQLDDRRLKQPDAALYYGVLLAATGATNEAAPYLKIARTKTQWLPEEQHLLSAALGEE